MLKEISLIGVSEYDQSFLLQHYCINESAEWVLRCIKDSYHIENERLELSMKLDFREGKYRYRNEHAGNEPLVKAIKIKKKLPTKLFDATPGVLKDSLMLASRGVSIIAVERNPLLFVMVRQALAGLNVENIEYHFGDAKEAFTTYSTEVIYLDPMYPTKKKSAQVKKDMQILHHIVGSDDDSDSLLEEARKHQSRVIVKRPNSAQSLGKQQPNFVSQTGSTRFDVYLPNS